MDERLPRALGWLSIGLGLPQLLAPSRFDRFIGVEPRGVNRAVTRTACGVRELAAGAGLLTQQDTTPFLVGRVAGDTLDLAMLLAALPRRKNRRGRVALALVATLGTTAGDVFAATRATSEKLRAA